ncbi:YciI family protein [Pseudactinotalea terrae]|uniref:YciI family protein n=1 Tax=Pseudactinotalea terrae TaxID=1743262 RepID=UPI0012E10602|nr:YciI family protein [Pseudactinotalea terrae]
MAEYVIYFNQQWVGEHTEEWFRGRVEPSKAVVEEMKQAGVYVFAGGLVEEGDPRFTVAHAVPTGDDVNATLTDGPYTESTEVLGGFAVVDVPDEETARLWAAKVAVGCGWPQEVRRVV